MQYSTNSNEALRFTIRSHPTLAGQYRQAMVQARDRLQALEAFRLSSAKIEQSILIDQCRLDQVQKTQPSPLNIAIWQAELELQKIEIEEKKQHLKQSLDLVEDARREVTVCNQEIDRIKEESNCDFAVMPLAEFQELMVDDFRQRKARAIAANLIMGGPAAIEMLIELPEVDRCDYLKRVSALIDDVGAIRLDLAALHSVKDPNRSLINGAA